MAAFSKAFGSPPWTQAAPHLLTACAVDSVRPLPLSFVLLTASRLLSSPPGTKIFQFPGYACTTIHSARFGNPRFKGRLAPTLGLSQLATTFVATRAKPSTRWLIYKLASPQINHAKHDLMLMDSESRNVRS
jgi:hypothetical protein